MRVEVNMKFEKDWFRLRLYRQQGIEIVDLYHTIYHENQRKIYKNGKRL